MKNKVLSFVVFFCSFSTLISAQSLSDSDRSSAKVSTPVDQDTCFSPDEPCSEKLVRFIRSAEKSIDMAIYSINLEDLVDTLIKKSEKIAVRIVCDKVQSHGVKSKVKYLLENGVNVRYGKQKGIMHDKFVIIDNRMLETGSFNFTNHASTSNEENQVYLSNPKIVNRFADRFESLWEKSTEINFLELLRDMERERI